MSATQRAQTADAQIPEVLNPSPTLRNGVLANDPYGAADDLRWRSERSIRVRIPVTLPRIKPPPALNVRPPLTRVAVPVPISGTTLKKSPVKAGAGDAPPPAVGRAQALLPDAAARTYATRGTSADGSASRLPPQKKPSSQTGRREALPAAPAKGAAISALLESPAFTRFKESLSPYRLQPLTPSASIGQGVPDGKVGKVLGTDLYMLSLDGSLYPMRKNEVAATWEVVGVGASKLPPFPVRQRADGYWEPQPPVLRLRGGGPAASRPAPRFRSDRGGDALAERAGSVVRFDQYKYRRSFPDDPNGVCEGLVRDAMRRMGGTDHPSLAAAVKQIRTALKGGKGDRDRIITSVADFQSQWRTPFRPLGYEPIGRVNYAANGNSQRALTSEQIRSDFLRDLHARFERMGKRSAAYLRLDLHRNGAPQPNGPAGHAILLEFTRATRGAEKYTVFDPNNGAFVIAGTAEFDRTLLDYLRSAYTAEGYTLEPANALYFGWAPDHVI
ncbi:hypothetical protein [Paraburkholderia humisilvae]|nr:hypothetical protein [Paraburkholderia humisilvae]